MTPSKSYLIDLLPLTLTHKIKSLNEEEDAEPLELDDLEMSLIV